MTQQQNTIKAAAQEVPLRPVPLRDVPMREIVEAIAAARPPVKSFVGVNAHTVFLAERDAEFRRILGETYRFCDGFGVHLLALMQGLPKPRHRNTPTDFMWEVFAQMHALGLTVFLVGDKPDVVDAFSARLDVLYPGLICGHHHGFFQEGTDEERVLVRRINDRGPHLICVGMGQPRQEKWVHRLRDELSCSAALHLGASMAFAVGARRRGPRWATHNGLEWLFRVLHEPRRMFFRYFVEIPWLASRAISYAIRRS